MNTARHHAQQIWQAGVAAVDPARLLHTTAHRLALPSSGRVLVVGCGKASGTMAEALEHARPDLHARLHGIVNVPEGDPARTRHITLNPARPAGSNFPTASGVHGTDAMLSLLQTAQPEDVALCLISGGGSALLPAPVAGVPLDDKLAITKLLHSSGADITAMNTVRKHLSRSKGGRLAEAFRGQRLIALILSDVVGDPLDVIASGPTVPDPSTFGDAAGILQHHQLWDLAPATVRLHLEAGGRGDVPDTPKRLPDSIENWLIGNNALALEAAAEQATQLGYTVHNWGSHHTGDTTELALRVAGAIRMAPRTTPQCWLIGGETTVDLAGAHGLGGRNQEFVLSLLQELGPHGMTGVTILSGGTDGEDGPTDAAGAIADADTFSSGVALQPYLAQHDSYHFFEAAGGLFKTGLTGTNVTDLRVLLLH